MNLLSVERTKEANRELALNKAKNEKERIYLEKIFVEERLEASERIIEFNE